MLDEPASARPEVLQLIKNQSNLLKKRRPPKRKISLPKSQKENSKHFGPHKKNSFAVVKQIFARQRQWILDDLLEYDKCFYFKLYNTFKASPRDPPGPPHFSFFSYSFPQQNKVEKFWLYVTQKKKPSDLDRPSIHNSLRLMFDVRGFPKSVRIQIWNFLIGNALRITPGYYAILFRQQSGKCRPNSLISKDLLRTFNHFYRSEQYQYVVKEAEVLLRMFEVYRPDIQYVQGMSFIMVMLLLNFSPQDAFKLFCNLVVGRPQLYSVFTFDEKFIYKVRKLFLYIVKKHFKKMYRSFVEIKFDCWNVLWVEFVYAMFLRSFDLETCFLL